MPWAKIDDQFFTHPKVIDLPKDAKLLYLASVTYCAGQLTDGHITPGALRVIAAMVDVSRDEAGTLITAGLWEIANDGFMIHDYHEYQPTRSQALATKQARSEAGSRGGHKAADSKAEAKAQANVKQNAQQNVKPISTPSPSYPILSESDPSSLRSEEEPTTKKSSAARAAQKSVAISLFENAFQKTKGRPPAIGAALALRMVALYESQGEDAYCRALDGFFGCLNDSDPFPKSKGFDVAVFVRQFDTWEGGQPMALMPSRASPQTAAKNGVNIAESRAATLAAITGGLK